MIEAWKTVNVESAWADLCSNGVSTVSIEQELYPRLLIQIHHSPPLLYYRGNLDLPKHCITVVGTRRISAYGHCALKKLLPKVLQAGIGLISGLAFGIDAAAHVYALEYGAYTAGVLASGAEAITPRGNEWLGNKILAAGGALISEFPCGTIPNKGSFARRNRLISALSKLTIVVEASTKSGALITARHAIEQNREVGAVPGSILSVMSNGCYLLLKEGAHVISDPDDILNLLGITPAAPVHKAAPLLSPDEMRIYHALSAQAMLVDDLCALLKLPLSQISYLLTGLEIQGHITKIPGRGYGLKG